MNTADKLKAVTILIIAKDYMFPIRTMMAATELLEAFVAYTMPFASFVLRRVSLVLQSILIEGIP